MAKFELTVDLKEAKMIRDGLMLGTQAYEDAGRVDINVKLHVKVAPHKELGICAYDTNRMIIAQAEAPSDFEYILSEFIRQRLTDCNLHVEKMVLV